MDTSDDESDREVELIQSSTCSTVESVLVPSEDNGLEYSLKNSLILSAPEELEEVEEKEDDIIITSKNVNTIIENLPLVVLQANRVADILCADIIDLKQRLILRASITSQLENTKNTLCRETVDALHVLQFIEHHVDELERIPYIARKKFIVDKPVAITYIYSVVLSVVACLVGKYII